MTAYLLCTLLFLIGVYCIATKRNLIKIIIGIGISGYAVNLFFVLLGYRAGGRAPIFPAALDAGKMVDPLPQALVLMFIVIGLGFGLFQAPNLNEILRGVKPAFIGLAASTNAVLKNLGSLVGITLIVAVFAWLSGNHALPVAEISPDLTAFRQAFALAAGVAALNLLANLLPRKP